MRIHHVAAALLMFAGPAFAQAVDYTCSFPYERARGAGWIPSIVALRDEPQGGVTVFDPLIRHFAGVPIPARRMDETRVRLSYNWELEVKARNAVAVMRYRLTIYKDGRPATIRAEPAGFENRFSGTGTCTRKPANP